MKKFVAGFITGASIGFGLIILACLMAPPVDQMIYEWTRENEPEWL